MTVRAQRGGPRADHAGRRPGPGHPRAELERIFEPFHRARGGAAARGSGLGLAIARGFIEANGGQMRAESLPGQGTTFAFQLPLPEEAAGGR